MEPISTTSPNGFQQTNQIPAEKGTPRKEHEVKTEFIHHNIIRDEALSDSNLLAKNCYYIHPSSEGGWTVTFAYEGKVLNVKLNSKRVEEIDKEIATTSTEINLPNGEKQIFSISSLPEYRMRNIRGFVSGNHEIAMEVCKNKKLCVRENSTDSYELYINIGNGKVVHFPLVSKDSESIRKEIKFCRKNWDQIIFNFKILSSIEETKEKFYSNLNPNEAYIDRKLGIDLLDRLEILNQEFEHASEQFYILNKWKADEEKAAKGKFIESELSKDARKEYDYLASDIEVKLRELEKEITEKTFGSIPIQSIDQLNLWKIGNHVGIMDEKEAASLLYTNGDWNIYYSLEKGNHIFQQKINGKVETKELVDWVHMQSVPQYVALGLAQRIEGG